MMIIRLRFCVVLIIDVLSTSIISRGPIQFIAESLSLSVAGKLDNIRNEWSNIAFALVWLDH